MTSLRKKLIFCIILFYTGVDNLLNLVVELYKQQKTVRAFESSVRSLRDDIMRELNVPKYKKQYASKKVREEIERTAKNRLHGKLALNSVIYFVSHLNLIYNIMIHRQFTRKKSLIYSFTKFYLVKHSSLDMGIIFVFKLS